MDRWLRNGQYADVPTDDLPDEDKTDDEREVAQPQPLLTGLLRGRAHTTDLEVESSPQVQRSFSAMMVPGTHNNTPFLER